MHPYLFSGEEFLLGLFCHLVTQQRKNSKIPVVMCEIKIKAIKINRYRKQDGKSASVKSWNDQHKKG